MIKYKYSIADFPIPEDFFEDYFALKNVEFTPIYQAKGTAIDVCLVGIFPKGCRVDVEWFAFVKESFLSGRNFYQILCGKSWNRDLAVKDLLAKLDKVYH